MLFLLREENGIGQVLLQKRKGGWGAGMWDASANGHLEAGESTTACLRREAKEEIGVDICVEDILFVNMCHDAANGAFYFNGYFFVKKFSGEPQICEPAKCGELKWFDINSLPEEILPNRKQAIQDYIAKIAYREFGWGG